MIFLALGAVLALVILAGYLVGVYNQLIQVRVNVDKAWSNIHVLEKQRYDELPKLVKVCETYMQFERETLERVIRARTLFMEAKGPAEVAKADSSLSSALKSLFAVAESYPDLKANQSFFQLQGRISQLENQIADRREFYNESVAIFNARIEQVPYVFVAQALRYEPREMYEVSEREIASPDISFGPSR
ncbi:MAG: LemA family protein [Nitrospirales bacterium]|nr:LemA family protein [Nitrospirales bacterium]